MEYIHIKFHHILALESINLSVKCVFFIEHTALTLISSSSTFRIGPSGLFPSEVIWNYGSSYTAIGLHARTITPVAKSLPTQET